MSEVTKPRNTKIHTENPMLFLLSDEGKLLLRILEKGEEGSHLLELVDDLAGISSKMTISKYIDKALDMGILHADWIKKEIDTKKGPKKAWVRNFRLRGEWKKVLKDLYTAI